MSANRYFIDQRLEEGETLELQGKEFRHAQLVMRRETGNSVALVNGRGQLAQARVLENRKTSIVLKIEQSVIVAPPKHELILVQGIVRWEALCWIVEKATEIGVTQIGFAGQKDSTISPSRLQRLRNIAIAAIKQSNNLHLPRIGPEQMWNAWTFSASTQIFCANPLGPKLVDHSNLALDGDCALLIGPEKGFSKDDLTYFSTLNVKSTWLSAHTLRSETAAICGLFLLKIAQERFKL